MATIQIRVDDCLREQASYVAQEMGLDLSSAVRVFLVQMVRENGFPFRPTIDPLYSSENVKAIQKSLEQLDRGEGISKTLEELERME